jgi:Fur family ferric uptake transcriptional regulator
MRTETYKTKQKESINNVIKSLNKDFTIKDLYTKLNSSVGLTTLYRYVDKLLEEGRIIKLDDTHYQYLEECEEENHFYLKCTSCGSLIHIDCGCVNDLFGHITSEHNFIPESKNIIINGTCSTCGGK